MIKYKAVSGRLCPFIECDGCGKPIDKAGEGLAKYRVDGTVWFYHKSIEGKKCDDGKGPWVELDLLLFYLAHNLGVDLKNIELRASIFSRL